MPEISPSKYLVQASWADVPHLDEQTKRELWNSTPPHLREARSKGIPALGAGAIYPIPWEEVIVEPFRIPDFWKRGYALDVGWNFTAAKWIAEDPSDGVFYFYAEYKAQKATPLIHATAIKQRGEWMRGAVDPGSRGRNQKDGTRLFNEYRQNGLNLVLANNEVEAGLDYLWALYQTGRLKQFSTLKMTEQEYRQYRRVKNTDKHEVETVKVLKKNDHCLHGDTLVITKAGHVPIRDLVGTVGLVLSVGGTWSAYRHCRMTAADQPTVRVRFEDGSTVRCTPDHKFLTAEGWVEAIDMTGRFAYDAVSQAERSPCRSKSSRIPSKSSLGAGTTVAVRTSSAMASAFTGMSGCITTAVQFLMDGTPTIVTRTSRTIRSTTWSSCSVANICPSTNRDTAERQPRRLSTPQRAGTPPMKGWLGTTPTTRTSRSSCTARSTTSARTARQSFNPDRATTSGSARTSASLRLAGHLASIMRRAPAFVAGLISRPTATPRPSHADAHAVLRCVGVDPADRADVFCLEAPFGGHAFAVETGVIVHNCMDCDRYAVRTFGKIAQVRPAHDRDFVRDFTAADQRTGY